jgi:hypothetical protein
MRAARRVAMIAITLLLCSGLGWAAHGTLTRTSAVREPQAVATGPRSEHLARRAQVAAHLDALLDRESRDPARAAELGRRAALLLGAEHTAAGLRVDDVTCASSLCRLRIRFAVAAQRARLEPLLRAIGPVLGSEAWSYGDVREDEITLYVAAAGARLPITEAWRRTTP